MIRLGAVFVAVCVVLIAVSLGAAAYLYFGLSRMEAALLTLAVLAGLTLYNAVTTRLRDHGDVGNRIADLARSNAVLASQAAELGRRLAALEGRVQNAEKAASGPHPFAAEIEVLGNLVQQLAESVAGHDAAIRRGGALPEPSVQHPPAAAVQHVPEAVPATVAPAPVAAASVTALAEAEAPSEDSAENSDIAENPAMVETIREAIEDGRIDLYLQPIVTLPQRKVRYYEALSRMRTENGDIVVAADFLPYAEAGGVIARIDNLALFRSVQVVRRLMLKSRDIGMFCNLAASTLANEDFFPQLIDFVDANRALSSSLVFEFTQPAVRRFGPVELASLAALAGRGFQFSMDQVADLRFEPTELADRGFRFVKVPASLLLDQTNADVADIHPEDLSDLLARHGIELIASMIESENVVVNLLDFDVRYGQGLLFSAPRPVRQEALRGMSAGGLAQERPVRNDKPAERAGGKPQGGLGQLARSAAGSA
jgi:cyclic-di-GMP phosphodiesterase TipF (flagellum assembly factor)